MSGFDVIGSELQRVRLLGESQSPGDGVDETRGGSDGANRFGNVLTESLRELGKLKGDVKQQSEALARGEPVEVHDLFIAMGKSEVAFNMMLEVRNKLIEAWQHLSRSVM